MREEMNPFMWICSGLLSTFLCWGNLQYELKRDLPLNTAIIVGGTILGQFTAMAALILTANSVITFVVRTNTCLINCKDSNDLK